MVTALQSLKQTCIGDTRSQSKQPNQQHQECGSMSSAGVEELHHANCSEGFRMRLASYSANAVDLYQSEPFPRRAIHGAWVIAIGLSVAAQKN